MIRSILRACVGAGWRKGILGQTIYFIMADMNVNATNPKYVVTRGV